jgi:hypothetical protein
MHGPWAQKYSVFFFLVFIKHIVLVVFFLAWVKGFRGVFAIVLEKSDFVDDLRVAVR